MFDLEGKDNDNIKKTPYLIYYIIIIVVLIGGIYFLSAHTCNIIKKNQENFENITTTSNNILTEENKITNIDKNIFQEKYLTTTEDENKIFNKEKYLTTTEDESKIVISESLPPVSKSSVFIVAGIATVTLLLLSSIGLLFYQMSEHDKEIQYTIINPSGGSLVNPMGNLMGTVNPTTYSISPPAYTGIQNPVQIPNIPQGIPMQIH